MKTMFGQHRRRGSALGVMLVLIALMSAAVGIMSTLSLQRSKKATRLAHKARSLSIAEAGARQVYSVLSTNFNARTNDSQFVRTACAGGTYAPTVVPIGEHRAAVHSVGRFQDIDTEVILDVGSQSRGGTTSGPPIDIAYDYAVLANIIDWSGGVTVNGYWIHSNTSFLLGGATVLDGHVAACDYVQGVGNAAINGDAKSPVYKKKAPGCISGNVYTGPVPLIPIPDIDLTPYYNWALANGEVYGSKTLKGGTFTPNGGVMWINGSLQTMQATLNGCFIATDAIDIQAHTHQNKVGNLPAFICRDGDIKIRSGTYTHGLLYTKVGNIDVAGNGGGAYLTGSIICAGELRLRGGYDAFTYENSSPVPPGGGGGTPGDDVLYITAWQK